MTTPAGRRLTLLVASALPLALLASLAFGISSARASLLGVTVGGKSLLGVTLGESEAGKPAVGVSVLSSTPEGQTQIAGVTVGGEPIVEVSASNTASPSAEVTTPVATVTTPTVTAPSPSKAPTETSAAGSSSDAATATVASAAPKAAGAGSADAGTSAASVEHARGSVGVASASRHRARSAERKPAASDTGLATTTASTTPRAPKSGSDAAVKSTRLPRSSRNPLSSLGSSLPLPLPVPDWSKPIILALALLALAMWMRSRFALRKARRLEGRQTELLRDMHAMQAALVPEIAPVMAGLGVSVAYRPAEGPAAGGDFYDVFLRGEDQVAIILGDVAGHGHDALEQATLTRYTLRAYMQTAGSPREALSLAGKALATPECDQLATVAAAIYDRRKGTLTYALAGHPAPILTGLEIAESPVGCSSPPLGWDVPTGLRQRTISLPDGACACFFSDGLVEARVSSRAGGQGLLGRERLRELLRSRGQDERSAELLAAVRAEAQATPDDMAACMITALESAPARHIDIEELELDERAAQSAQLQGFLEECGLRAVEAERVVGRARAEACAHERALLIVDRSRAPVRATVLQAGEATGSTSAASVSPSQDAVLSSIR